MIRLLESLFIDILASAIIAMVAWLTRKIWFRGFYSDVVRVYKSEKHALKDINKDIGDSECVKLLAIRGRSITDKDRGEYPSLWKNEEKEIEIIVSSESNEVAIEARASAANVSASEYQKDVKFTNDILIERMKTFKNLTVYTHNENLSFKLILCDNCVYVCYFLPQQSVHKSSIIKYKSDTGAYDAFLHYYNGLKNNISTNQLVIKG